MLLCIYEVTLFVTCRVLILPFFSFFMLLNEISFQNILISSDLVILLTIQFYYIFRKSVI